MFFDFDIFNYHFSFHFTWMETVIFACLLLFFVHQLYFYLRYICGAIRLNKKQQKNKGDKFTSKKPSVSVVVCAKNEEENLRNNLPAILGQNYPDFEVIVINDCSYDATEQVLDDFKKQYKNLHTTFIPEGTKNLSTKKLGITLGIKAANNDFIVLTDADCRPASPLWLEKITSNFHKKTEIVLGYGAYNEYPTFLNRLITYDTLFIGLQYLGMALAGKTYMGVGRNLAYKKDIFFRHNGFAKSLHLLAGDDDLFVNQTSTRHNTRIEISKESITWSEPKKTFADWQYQKMRHLSVSGHYSSQSRNRLIIEPLTRGLFYLFFIFALVFGNFITMMASALLFLIRYFVQFAIINKSSKHFGGRRYYFSLIVADLFLPLQNLYLLTVKQATRKRRSW